MNLAVSVVILTRDEEQDLPGCLDTVRFSDDIHVYDSYSTDATTAIARNFGATVTQRTFDDWSTHQNWGLRNLPFRYPWVFYLDADERVTPALTRAIGQFVADPGEVVAGRCRRHDHFLGRHLAHVQATGWYIRLFRPERITYERLVNPVTVVDGRVETLSGHLDHFPFSKGLAHWIDRHRRYSTFEARQTVSERLSDRRIKWTDAWFTSDRDRWRRCLKTLFYRLPCRPQLKFLLLYVFKRGFLDGYPGYVYARLQAIYERMIVIKTRALLVRARRRRAACRA